MSLEARESEPLAFGKAAEEHRATPVEAVAARFRNPPEGSFNLGGFADGNLIGIVTFMREAGLKQRHKGSIPGGYGTLSHRGRGIRRKLITSLLEREQQDSWLESSLV